MKKSIPIPPNCQDAFRKATFRTSFNLALSQPMIEMLCAIADGVCWDRTTREGPSTVHVPDNWVASTLSLEKRGLIRNATDAEKAKERRQCNAAPYYEWSNWRLTPIGDCVVQMFKVAGIFVEADAAILKRTRKA